MKSKHSSLKHKLITAIVLALALVSSVEAVCPNDVPEPVVRFIDFYIAAEKAEAPKISAWQRIVYGLAIAFTPEKPSAASASRPK